MEYVKEYIKTKEDLKKWLAMDAVHYATQQLPLFQRLKYNLNTNAGGDQKYTWAYVKTLRYAEYHTNNHSLWHTLCRLYYMYKLRKLSYRTAIQIPPNAVGPGLFLPHFGAVNINENSIVGRNVTIYSGVRLGWKNVGGPCPKVGNNVFIGTGTNIIGDVCIGDNAILGQNCVIIKDVEANSVVVAQAPRILR